MTSKNYHGGSVKILYSKLDFERQENLFNFQLFFMKCVGQVPVQLELYFPKSCHTFAKGLAKSYCVFSAISTLHLAILYIKTTFDMLQHGKLEEITDALTMAIIYSFACFATCYWLWRSTAFLNFLNGINEQYRHHSIAGLTFVSAQSSFALAHKITKYWQLLCITGVICWALAPLILGSHTLPLKCWYPFDPLVSSCNGKDNDWKVKLEN